MTKWKLSIVRNPLLYCLLETGYTARWKFQLYCTLEISAILHVGNFSYTAHWKFQPYCTLKTMLYIKYIFSKSPTLLKHIYLINYFSTFIIKNVIIEAVCNILNAESTAAGFQRSGSCGKTGYILQTSDLKSVHIGVKFSCNFTLQDIEDRWYSLLYNEKISKWVLLCWYVLLL